MSRSSGLLLHPTSLPGPHGIGSLGADAERFAGLLSEMYQSWWQMLPIGPTGYGDSPYQSPSTFAGNPLLIDLDVLVEDGLLSPRDLQPIPATSPYEVDFGAVASRKQGLVTKAAMDFGQHGKHLLDRYEEFTHRHARVWLDDFAIFTALKRAHQLSPWWEWDRELVNRRPETLAAVGRQLAEQVAIVKVEQFIFDQQFHRLRRVCLDRGIRLIGDIPIFVAHDSADVWANPDLYHLDQAGMPMVVAGVPPDYFSKTGQRWGNPLYRWERHIESDFSWWTERLKRSFELFDLVRIDHFRGFVASWHIPVSELTAANGEWVKAPGEELFDHLAETFASLPVIAEDLGVITPEVVALRDRYHLPGMKILQFGFGTESHHAPDQFGENVIAYTGTHDNDTAAGWFEDTADERIAERNNALETLGSDGTDFAWDLIGGVMGSIADTAIIPVQDLLSLGTEARMNFPGTTTGNWRWRFEWEQMTSAIRDRMRRLTIETHRR